MPTTLSGTVTSAVKFLFQNSQAFNLTFTGSPSRLYERKFSSTDITKLYFGSFSVTSSPTTVDVTSLTDSYGNDISFATVKHVLVVNNDATNNLTVGGGTNALFAELPVLVGQAADSNSDGSCVNLTTNLTVSGSAKNIKLVASAGTISVDVVIVGT